MSDFFSNPFASKPEADTKPDDKEVEENVNTDELDEGEDEAPDAVQNLIYHSFFPATCMVPLDEDIITINETVPELMKAKSQDTMLQETIKTFHSLMSEKDDEILNLRKQLQALDDVDGAVKNKVKYASSMSQTVLTLDACETMERQLQELSKDIPQKKAKIAELRKEKNNLNSQMSDIRNSFKKSKSFKRKEAYDQDKSSMSRENLEADLDEAYKELERLEIQNSALSKELEEMKTKLQQMTWNYEEVYELKGEVEEAKLIREEEMRQLTAIMVAKEKQLNDLIKQNKELKESAQSMTFKLPNKVQEIREKGKETKSSDPIEAENVIIAEKITKYTNIPLEQSNSPFDMIYTITEATTNQNESQSKLTNETAVLLCMEIDEKGKIKSEKISDKDVEMKINELKSCSKSELCAKSQTYGYNIGMKEMHMEQSNDDLTNEFIKLDLILNQLNKNYSKTPLSNIKKYKKLVLTDYIVNRKRTIFEISMHDFWTVVFETGFFSSAKYYNSINFTSANMTLLTDAIFIDYTTKDQLEVLLTNLNDVKNILLNGKCSKRQFHYISLLEYKLQSFYVLYDLVAHIIPTYPNETRSKLFQETIEESVFISSKLTDKLSKTFIKDLVHLYPKINQSPCQLAEVIFEIFDLLNFENGLLVEKSFLADFEGGSLKFTKDGSEPTKGSTKFSSGSNKTLAIIDNLSKLNKILNIENGNLNSKSDKDLMKDLIGIKQKVLQKMFNDDPEIPSLKSWTTIVPETMFLSCVSDEKIQLWDFWCKLIHQKYESKVIEELAQFQSSELQVCLDRLKNIMSILDIKPTYVNESDSLPRKIWKFRRNIYHKLKELLNTGPDISQYFKMTDNISNNANKLNDLLKRLYEIDAIIYFDNLDQPSDSTDLHMKDFSRITPSEISDEIISLRIVLTYYSSLYYAKNVKTITNMTNQINDTLKQTKNIMLTKQPKLLSDKVRYLEVEQWQEIEDNLSKLTDEELIEIHEIIQPLKSQDSNNTPDNFNNLNQQQKIQCINETISKILPPKPPSLSPSITTSPLTASPTNNNKTTLNPTSATTDTSNKLINDKVIELLKSIRADKNFKVKKNISPMDTVNYLCEIQGWIVENQKWRHQCQIKLTNSVKKLSTKVNQDNKPFKMSTNNLQNDISDIGMEKELFEKTFAELEAKINEIPVDRGLANSAPSVNSRIDGNLSDKSEPELKKLIVSFEKELANGKWNSEMEAESEEWLRSRSKSELVNDCKVCMDKLMLTKMNDVLIGTRTSHNSSVPVRRSPTRRKNRPKQTVDNDARINEFENDIEKKLAKYQQLCDAVDGLKVPQPAPRRLDDSQDYMDGKKDDIEIPKEHLSLARKQRNRSKSPSNYRDSHPSHNDNEADYFTNRLTKLQNLIKQTAPPPAVSSSESNECQATFSRIKRNQHQVNGHNNDVLVDGFDIEEDKSSRFYSMRLQDLHHQRQHDELAALLQHTEQHQHHLVEENKSLRQKLYVAQNLLDTLQSRMDLLEKTERGIREKIRAETENGSSGSEAIYLREEQKRLCAALGMAEKQMDAQNQELAALTGNLNSLQHENHTVYIKNQHLERSFKKMEETYMEMVNKLEEERSIRLSKSKSDHTNQKLVSKENDFSRKIITDLESRLQQNDADKLELIRKLDVIEQQNKLLKEHCEKLDSELIRSHKQQGELNTETSMYKNEMETLSRMIQELQQKQQHKTMSKQEADELTRLRKRNHDLETKLATSMETPSQTRLRDELMAQRDKEIMKLKQELGVSRDLLEESKAQLDVKDYETRKLVKANKQLHNQLNDSSYYPPAGYKLVRDS